MNGGGSNDTKLLLVWRKKRSASSYTSMVQLFVGHLSCKQHVPYHISSVRKIAWTFCGIIMIFLTNAEFRLSLVALWLGFVGKIAYFQNGQPTMVTRVRVKYVALQRQAKRIKLKTSTIKLELSLVTARSWFRAFFSRSFSMPILAEFRDGSLLIWQISRALITVVSQS